ncbi:DNA polymerase III subunit alpha [Botrimarina hoheduenensis]|uniref:DNA polymerase III subunit alpha n=1 Tax=Botrimarina hoheduenensis TaxID=2528000 RepID=A0A5C5WBL0_9BACT|nr:DNA polymerase III subunit alpha [Botrimarina hoheduenensis]TWT47469.1 DNA polymerase III subunit alpha [Botrimarina hoheduenensis]
MDAAKPFVHLHCHSHYSLLDGASPIKKLVGRAKELGMNALSLTDHGNLYGALEFYKACRAEEINPIVGYEAYIAPGSRHDKSGATRSKEAAYHLTLLAKNKAGFRNLVKMASRAYLEGFYHKPRIDKELLEAHSEGIICLSGCVSGELSKTLLSGASADEALQRGAEITGWFSRVFGDRYFLEIQDNGVEIQRAAKELTIELANRQGLPLVATSDAHYVNREDAEAQDVLLCINTGRFRTDTNRMRMEGDQFYLRSAEDMYAAMPDVADAVARSQTIADSVDLDLELGKRYFPTFTTPNNPQPDLRASEAYLRELCLIGLKDRYAQQPDRWQGGDATSNTLADEVLQRLDRELGVINKLGFPDYFLIVWDFVRFAVERGIPSTARGSGVGSLVCYALRLSHVCPLRYDLLFERFLDESRLEAPDIDIDFCKERRGEVIQYVKDKYGEDNVAQIGTFGTLAARAAIKDVGRTMSMPIFRVDQITAMVPEQLGITLAKALETSEELARTYESDPEVRELLDLAQKIEGLARNVGTHAAAVVISEKPVDEYVPLQRVKGKTEVITQWAMNDVEAAGLLKMDFLGLRNLTILAKSVELIEQSTGERVDPYAFPLDDKESYALLCRGETKGIFQLESGGIRDLLQRMKPDNFLDIIATAALYRPGPLEGGMVDQYIEVKHGRREAEYPHPVMKEVLEETHGVMVYQEQVMRILNRLGGIPLSSAYTCIKAISKKKLPMIAKFHEEFLTGAQEQGLDKKRAEELFEMIKKFAGYGFNKSHSTAYALIAYMTAYLKAHFPVEFMAALLTGDIPGRNFKSKDALVEHLEDCKRMGVRVEPPNVNHSDVAFAVIADDSVADDTVAEGTAQKKYDRKILFGLSAIKACGGGAAEAIAAARRQDGPFKDLYDFCERVDPSVCNRATIETLIKAGAMDGFGANRASLMAGIDKAMQSGAAVLADRRSGQKGLFGDEDDAAGSAPAPLPDVPEIEEKELLILEKEVLGFYLTSHPLAEHEKTLRTFCSHTSTTCGELEHRTEVVMGGMLAAIKISHTKNPKPGAPSKYAMWDLEDMDGIMRCILWPEQFAQFGSFVVGDAVVGVRGAIDRRPGAEEVNLIVNELMPIDELSGRYTSGVTICVREQEHGEQRLKSLREILGGYPGHKGVKLRLDLAEGGSVHLEGIRGVDLHPELRRRVDELLGPGCFHLTGGAPPAKAPERRGGRGKREPTRV